MTAQDYERQHAVACARRVGWCADLSAPVGQDGAQFICTLPAGHAEQTHEARASVTGQVWARWRPLRHVGPIGDEHGGLMTAQQTKARAS